MARGRKKRRGRAKAEVGAPQASSGLVLRSIKDGPEGGQLISLIQQIGELRFGVKRIEELNAEQKHNWIKLSNAIARAQGDYSRLTALIAEVIEELGVAEISLSRAKVADLERRREVFEKQAAEERNREEAREHAEEERKDALFKVVLADQELGLRERESSHAQYISDRKVRRAWDMTLIGISVFSVLLSAFLIVFAVVHEKLIFLGGSGVTAVIAVAGIVRIVWGWRESAPPEMDAASPETERIVPGLSQGEK